MFLRNYLTHLQRACADGAPVKGYFCWSLLDNFAYTDARRGTRVVARREWACPQERDRSERRRRSRTGERSGNSAPAHAMTALPEPKNDPPKTRGMLRALRRPLTVAFLVALVAHLPVTPLFPLLRVLRRLAVVREQPKEWDYEKKPEPSIPIELLELPQQPPEAPAVESDNSFALPARGGADPSGAAEKLAAEQKALGEKKAAEAKAAAQRVAEEKKASGEKEKKANVKFAKSASPADDEKDDGDKTDDGFPAKSKKKSKGNDKRTSALPDEKPQKEAPKETVGLSGALSEKVVGKPNVTLAMWFPPVREHSSRGWSRSSSRAPRNGNPSSPRACARSPTSRGCSWSASSSPTRAG